MKKDRFFLSAATVFGVGYFPGAPGTAGSLAGLILCLLLHGYTAGYIAVFAFVFAFGVVSSEKAERSLGCKDPSVVVIDEFACIFLVYMFIPLSASIIITGFFLYRVIDILKLPPMRPIEKINGGWGIMLDDLVAGVYANLILRLALAANIL